MPQKGDDYLIGTNLDKCRLISKLGAGGMGSVYLAEHFGLNRRVALKILPADMSRDPEYVARFMREATAAGRMEHVNIIPVYDVGFAKNRHFIIMQYIDGESLSTYVDNLGAMEPQDAARLAVGILRGLHHAHERGIVHRDVKPDNVLIAKGNEPKLLDFGLAIETESSLKITKDGLVVGTPYYLSPEQARGQKATPQADIYATGVTLYYLLTGRRPFVGATALAVLNKHIHEAAIPPHTVNPKIPKPLSEIVLKLMAKRPEDRYQSAGEGADDLERFLKGTPLKRILSWRLRLASLTKRSKMILGGSAAGVAAILLISIIALAMGGEDTETPPDQPPAGGPPPTQPTVSPASAWETDWIDLRRFEDQSDKKFTRYPQILARYRTSLDEAPNEDTAARALERRDLFVAKMEKQALEIYAGIPQNADPWLRLQELDRFPKALLPIADAGKRVERERESMNRRLEERFQTHRARLNSALESGDFEGARTLLGDMLRYSTGKRREDLISIQKDLPRLEMEFKDPLVQAYAKVHDNFEAALIQRQIPDAYKEVTAFIQNANTRAARTKVRAPGINYRPLLEAVPDNLLTASKLGQLRLSLATVWARAEDSLSYRILADLQDALDLRWIIQRSGQGLSQLSLGRSQEVRFLTYNGVGVVRLGGQGFVFEKRGGGQTVIEISKLHPADLVLLAAKAEQMTAQDAFDSNATIARAAGAAYLYSDTKDRWPSASRWILRALELNAAAPSSRLPMLRARASEDFSTRLVAARKSTEARKFDEARITLKRLSTEWGHDREWRPEINKAMAALLESELGVAGSTRNHPRVKQLARDLRASYDGLFNVDKVNELYGHALRQTGQWQPVSTNLKGTNWDWPGKASNAPAPAKDEGYQGLRLGAGKSIQIGTVRVRGSHGLSFSVRLNDKSRTYKAGLEFDRSMEDGTYRRLVLEDPGHIALYTGDTDGELLLRQVPIENVKPGKWVDIGIIFESEDLFCYTNQKPVITLRAEVANDRPFVLFTTTDTSFKSISIRR